MKFLTICCHFIGLNGWPFSSVGWHFRVFAYTMWWV